MKIIRNILVWIGTLLVAAGCAGGIVKESPFFNDDPAKHVEGATRHLDPDRRFGTRQAVFRYVDRTGDKSRPNDLAARLEALAVSENVVGAAVGETLARWATDGEVSEADAELLTYFSEKLAVRADMLVSPLSPEQRRILGVYADAIQGALL